MKTTTMKNIAIAAIVALALAAAPSALAEDAWIASTDRVSPFEINTGYLAKTNTAFTIDFEMLDLQGQQRLFAEENATSSGGRGYIGVYINGSAATGGKLAFNFSEERNWISTRVTAYKNTRYKMTVDSENQTISILSNSVYATYLNAQNVDTGNPIDQIPFSSFTDNENTRTNAVQQFAIFGEYPNQHPTYRSHMKLYRLTATEGGVVVHDYIPYLKNGVAGVRDLITGEFLTNADSAENGVNATYKFAYGGDIAKEETVDFTGTSAAHPDYDSGAFLESYGTGRNDSPKTAPCIDTGYLVKENTKICADFELLDLIGQSRVCGLNESGGGFLHLYINGSAASGGAIAFNFSKESNNVSTGITAEKNKRYVMTLDQYSQTASLTVDGVQVLNGAFNTIKSATYTRFNASTRPLYVFCNDTAGSIGTVSPDTSTGCHMKLYRFTISETEDGVETVVHDYIPYVKNGKGGLWDLIDGVFLPEAKNRALYYTGKNVLGDYGETGGGLEVSWTSNKITKIVSDVATGSKFIVGGEAMSFVENPVIEFEKGPDKQGVLQFTNTIACAGNLVVRSQASDGANKLDYGPASDAERNAMLLDTGNNWTNVLTGARLSDWEIDCASNSAVNTANPNTFYPYQVKRFIEDGVEHMTAQMQWINSKYAKIIEVELRQSGANIQARILGAWNVHIAIRDCDGVWKDGFGWPDGFNFGDDIHRIVDGYPVRTVNSMRDDSAGTGLFSSTTYDTPYAAECATISVQTPATAANGGYGLNWMRFRPAGTSRVIFSGPVETPSGSLVAGEFTKVDALAAKTLARELDADGELTLHSPTNNWHLPRVGGSGTFSLAGHGDGFDIGEVEFLGDESGAAPASVTNAIVMKEMNVMTNVLAGSDFMTAKMRKLVFTGPGILAKPTGGTNELNKSVLVTNKTYTVTGEEVAYKDNPNYEGWNSFPYYGVVEVSNGSIVDLSDLTNRGGPSVFSSLYPTFRNDSAIIHVKSGGELHMQHDAGNHYWEALQYQKYVLDGGTLRNWRNNGNSAYCYICSLTMAGATLESEKPIFGCVHYQGAGMSISSDWRIRGESPSYFNASIALVGNGTNILDVADVTGDNGYDFYINGDIYPFTYDDTHLATYRKIGKGTVFHNGNMQLVGRETVFIESGAWVLGAGHEWQSTDNVVLTGGATLAAESGAVFGDMGSLTVVSNSYDGTETPAVVSLAADTTIRFADSSACEWQTNLFISGFRPGAISFGTSAAGLTPEQLAMIGSDSADGDKYYLSSDGGLYVTNTVAESSLPYIESDGTNYVNLGYFVNPDCRIEVDFQLTDDYSSAQGVVFGEYENADQTQTLRLRLGSASGFTSYCFIFNASQTTPTSSGYYWTGRTFGAVDTNFHTAVVDYFGAGDNACKFSFDGVSSTLTGVANATASTPLLVFAQGRGKSGVYNVANANYQGSSTYQNPAKMKLYRVKIYERDEEIRDYVPCVKGGVAGLYEKHSGEFHTSEKYGALKYGGEGIMTIEDDPYVALSRNSILIGVETNAFIETGYMFKPTSRVELDYALLTPDWPFDNSIGNWYRPVPMSARIVDSDGKLREILMLNSGDANHPETPYTLDVCIGAKTNNLTSISLATPYGIRRTAVFDKRSFTLITAGYTNVVSTVSAANEMVENAGGADSLASTLKIGAGYQTYGDSPTNTWIRRFTPMKVYGLKIYESDALVKDYRPYMEEGVAYLRDELAGGLIRTRTLTLMNAPSPDTVASTNTMMSAGGDISRFNFASEREKNGYLEFDGVNGEGHVLHTGYFVNKDTRIEADLSLWFSGSRHNKYSDTNGVEYTANLQQILFDQVSDNDGTYFRFFIHGYGKYSYNFVDRTGDTSVYDGIDGPLAENVRRRYVFDGPSGRVQIFSDDGTELKGETMPGSRERADGNTRDLSIGGECKNNGNTTCMRLYGLKIYESGVLVKNYAPYRNADDSECGLRDTLSDQTLALTGGKVEGGDWRDVPGDQFLLSGSPTSRYYTRELKFVAAGAVDYKWYRGGTWDPATSTLTGGEKIDNDGNETLSVTWERTPPPYKGERYTVVPTYRLFGQEYEGTPSSTQIINTPAGLRAVFL